jgi:hypothetical protein
VTRILSEDGVVWAKITFLFNDKRDPIVVVAIIIIIIAHILLIIRNLKEIRQFIRCNPLKLEIQVNKVLKNSVSA